MLWVGLQTICVGSLLVQAASVCLSQDELQKRTDNLMGKLSSNYPVEVAQPERTCAEAAEQMRGGFNNRALSPWRFRLDQDQDRIPEKISMAECLCGGCIVNGIENHNYSSVHLVVKMQVHKKTRCKRDQNKYKLTKEFIKVPVGCVCVIPNYTNQQPVGSPSAL